MIRCANPLEQYNSYKEEIDTAISSVLTKGNYILGDEVKSFEQEFSDFIGVDYGIGVGNGTDALLVALKACGVGHEDEVITVSHTAVATATSIIMSGAKPVLVDIEPNFYSIDLSKLESAITEKTKAIILVHLYGCPAEIENIKKITKKHNIFLIEDCAQAHGAVYKDSKVGSFGDLSCFSFYPTKNLGAIGDGGMVLTKDDSLAERCFELREYGWKERYSSSTFGWNTRLDEIQAAILRVKLKYLDIDNKKRKRIAQMYKELLDDSIIELPKERKESSHVYHLFVIQSDNRDSLMEYLHQKDIFVNIHYPLPIHLQPFYKSILQTKELKITESIAKKILSLPMYPELLDEEVEEVSAAVNNFDLG
tara:strand:- start:14113 stop:15210 length:1098 start_codon:yes stop_codon:yes gene_type:complete